ncbi:hypothetical protein D3C72_1382100 [compost metagenome]
MVASATKIDADSFTFHLFKGIPCMMPELQALFQSYERLGIHCFRILLGNQEECGIKLGYAVQHTRIERGRMSPTFRRHAANRRSAF